MHLLRTALVTAVLLAGPACARAAWLGPWGNPVASARHGDPVALVSDAASGVLVAYQGAGVPGGDAIRVQHVLADGTRAPGWPADGVVACSLATTTRLGLLRAVSDGGGGAYLVWNESFFTTSAGTGYVQRVLADGSRAPGWPARGRALVASGGQTGHQVLAAGGGSVLVVWAANNSVRSLRVLPDGANAPAYPVTGRVLWSPLATGNATAPKPSLAADEAGGFWVSASIVSSDTLVKPSSHRVQHLDPAGAIDGYWLGDGMGVELPVPSSASVQDGSRVLADGAEGLYALARVGDRAMLAHLRYDQVPDPDWPQAWLDLGPAEQLSGNAAALEADGAGGLYAQWSEPYLALGRGLLRRVLTSGTLDPSWPAAVRVTASHLPTLLADATGVYASGTFLYDCPHQDCLAVSAITRRRTDGGAAAGWPQAAAGFWAAGEYGLPDSANGGPVDMVRDGGGGVFAAWTAPAQAGGYYDSDGTVRVMRFSAAGPVADVPASGQAPQAIRSVRFTREGLRVTLAGAGSPGAELAVHDVGGRRVGGVPRDAAALRGDVLVPGTAGLRPGVYLVRLRSGGRESHAKAVVVR